MYSKYQQHLIILGGKLSLHFNMYYYQIYDRYITLDIKSIWDLGWYFWDSVPIKHNK